MAETRIFTAAGDTLTVSLKGQKNGAVACQSGAGAHASGVAVLEYSYNGVDFVTPVRMRNPVGNADVDSLTSPNKAGWAEAPLVRKARLRCTVITGGQSMPVWIEAQEG